jgi:ribose transport system permease protein
MTKLATINLIRNIFPFLVLIFICIIFSLLSEFFFTIRNIETVSRQAAVLSIAALGGTFIIIMGSIDLSVGAVVGVASVLTAFFVSRFGYWGIPVGILVGALFGSINGFFYSIMKIPSFIVTLGGLVAGHGIILIITQGKPILIKDKFLRSLGAGDFVGLPIIVWLSIIAIIVAYIVHKYTVFGRSIVSIGGNENVAIRAGINVTRIKFMTFMIAGIFAGLAGIILTLRMGAGSPRAGTGLELDVIAAVVLGGTLLTGGIGNPIRTLIGVIIIAVLSNGLNIVGVSAYVQLVVKGLVLIFAVMISLDRIKIGTIK